MWSSHDCNISRYMRIKHAVGHVTITWLQYMQVDENQAVGHVIITWLPYKQVHENQAVGHVIITWPLIGPSKHLNCSCQLQQSSFSVPSVSWPVPVSPSFSSTPWYLHMKVVYVPASHAWYHQLYLIADSICSHCIGRRALTNVPGIVFVKLHELLCECKHTWLTHDSHMAHTWLTHDSHMTHTWCTHDSHMTHTWHTHDSHMTHTWLTHDTHMTHTWRTCLTLHTAQKSHRTR